MIEWLVGLLALVGSVLYLALRKMSKMAAELEATKRRAKVAQDMRRYERDAEVQDDASLADRISNR